VKKSLLAASVLTLALAIAASTSASGAPADKTSQPTSGQLKQMTKDAHTPEQYSALAQSYGQLQKAYLDKASEEKQEWDRRSQDIVSIAAKYPRPVDSARYLYEYYTYKATEAGALATKYSQLAAPVTK
jgi:alkylhydroperoxidase/carboxymuconolactone decarboxylase family protein YurZ